MWKKYRLKVLLQLLLVVVVSSPAVGNYSRIPKTSRSDTPGNCLYHYGIRVRTNSTSKVCPVTNLEPTVLQPLTNPKINGSFFVDWRQSEGQVLFDLQHVVEQCCPESIITVVAGGASDNRCDKLYVVGRRTIDRGGLFFIKYISSEGEVVVTEILYGPYGVSITKPLPEDDLPLVVNDRTSLQYELRISIVDSQFLSSPILCERTPNGAYRHTSAFEVQPHSLTSGCLSSFDRNGYSTPYITDVTPGNLSLLFSDPTAVYLTYSGTCNSSDTSLSSAITNITVTDSTSSLTTIASTTTQYNETFDTMSTNSTIPPTASVSAGPTSQSADPTTAGNSVPMSTDDADIVTTAVSAVVESTEVTHITEHPGSTYIATSVNSNPLHLTGSWIVLVIASVLVSVAMIVFVSTVLFFFFCKHIKKHKRKLDVMELECPDVKIRDSLPPVSLTGINTGDVDTDSGVVDGSPNGGTPLSNHVFTMNEQDCTTPTQRRESGLTSSTGSRSSDVIREIHDLSKKMVETHKVVEDFRDFIYAEKLPATQNENEEEAG